MLNSDFFSRNNDFLELTSLVKDTRTKTNNIEILCIQFKIFFYKHIETKLKRSIFFFSFSKRYKRGTRGKPGQSEKL